MNTTPRTTDTNETLDVDAILAADPDFQTVCDERRDGWIEAMEADEGA